MTTPVWLPTPVSSRIRVIVVDLRWGPLALLIGGGVRPSARALSGPSVEAGVH